MAEISILVFMHLSREHPPGEWTSNADYRTVVPVPPAKNRSVEAPAAGVSTSANWKSTYDTEFTPIVYITKREPR